MLFAQAAHRCSTTAIEVVRPGMLTTVQDWPGRTGYWHVGVPPSGPMDDVSFRLGNRVLGNPEGAAGLECTRGGPALRFPNGGRVCVTGAPVSVTLNAAPVPQWQSITIPPDGALDFAPMTGPGMRCYVLVAGGLREPEYLGSTATFTLGAFGGHGADHCVKAMF
jgi:urea carboxylase